MKRFLFNLLPCFVSAVGLVACAVILFRETESLKALAESWAVRDLTTRTQLVAENLADALARDDFSHLLAFAHAHPTQTSRLTVLTASGGMCYDSHPRAAGNHSHCPEVLAAQRTGEGVAIRRSITTHARTLFCARKVGHHIVRLAVPYAQVIESVTRNRLAFLLAGLVGASGILLVFFVTLRLLAHNRALARERETQEKVLVELRKVADFRRDFVANLSHEIKTPLTGILGCVDLLQTPHTGEAEQASLLSMLAREAHHLDDLARDLLALARMEQASAEIHPECVDLNALMEEVCTRTRLLADKNHTRVVVEKAPDGEVWCDVRLMEHALLNLVENALKHAHAPVVTMTLKKTFAEACLSVRDEGVGIRAEDCARIFERFYRVDRSHTGEGSGLGLALVKHMMQLQGGRVTVDSVPQKGSTFTIIIPLQVKQPQSGKEEI